MGRPTESEKRAAIDRLAQRAVDHGRQQGVKITHEQARKELALPAAIRHDRRKQ